MSPASLGKKLKKARDLMKTRHPVEALPLYAMLVEHMPDGYGEYGSVAAESGDLELASRLWDKHRARESKSGRALAMLAGECGKMGLNTKARTLWIEAASAEPRNLELQEAVATFLARVSGGEETRSAVQRCLELDPGNEQARYLAAHLDRRKNKQAEAERQVRELLASGIKTPQVRYSCHAELAHILDRTERFQEAMAQLEEGKAFARQNLNFSDKLKSFFEEHEVKARQTKALPKDILQIWGKTFPPSVRNAVSPVAFLSGSARSGTTLLERVLDAHPQVAASDETLAFDKLQYRIDVAAPSIPAQRLNVLRELYMKNMATVLQAPVAGKTLVDKNPSRTTWLPAFLRVFPELRVLIALRDPRDIMISLYFQDHPYSNYRSLEELARHYASVMDAWLAVREWEGLNWLETRYEDTVADLEKEGSRVTKFLGLEWHEKQARFFDHNREKPIMSNNASDVAKPVYKRSVGRWRVYEKQLAPVLPILEPYCRKFGYE
jgi:tetratricopeptide (TPR) repeat protein